MMVAGNDGCLPAFGVASASAPASTSRAGQGEHRAARIGAQSHRSGQQPSAMHLRADLPLRRRRGGGGGLSVVPLAGAPAPPPQPSPARRGDAIDCKALDGQRKR
jgi:hypothetical protein